MLVFFDLVSGEVDKACKLKEGESADDDLINQIVTHPSRNILTSAHEDGSISVFDFNDDRVI